MLHDDYICNEQLNQIISVDEVRKVVSKLKNKKSTGIDLIPNEILKREEVEDLLCALFNSCFNSGLVPSVWVRALVKPIPKGADKDPYIPLNYRGISLLSCVGKCYSSLLNNRIVGFCNQADIFADEQNGFRQGRSCEDHIFSLYGTVKNNLNKGNSSFCAFVDLEKAFDWLNRDCNCCEMLCCYRKQQIFVTHTLFDDFVNIGI